MVPLVLERKITGETGRGKQKSAPCTFSCQETKISKISSHWKPSPSWKPNPPSFVGCYDIHTTSSKVIYSYPSHVKTAVKSTVKQNKWQAYWDLLSPTKSHSEIYNQEDTWVNLLLLQKAFLLNVIKLL